MRPVVNPDLLDVPLCNLPRLSRPFVAKMEAAGFVTVQDCLDRWDVLWSCCGTWRTRSPLAPKHVGGTFIRQLASAFSYYGRHGAPVVDSCEDDPTPVEIRQRAAEVRDGWDALRWSEYERQGVEVQVVRVPDEFRRSIL